MQLCEYSGLPVEGEPKVLQLELRNTEGLQKRGQHGGEIREIHLDPVWYRYLTTGSVEEGRGLPDWRRPQALYLWTRDDPVEVAPGIKTKRFGYAGGSLHEVFSELTPTTFWLVDAVWGGITEDILCDPVGLHLLLAGNHTQWANWGSRRSYFQVQEDLKKRFGYDTVTRDAIVELHGRNRDRVLEFIHRSDKLQEWIKLSPLLTDEVAASREHPTIRRDVLDLLSKVVR